MLIIAQPRSASTSTMVTLGALLHKPARQLKGGFVKGAHTKEFKLLQSKHSDAGVTGVERIRTLSSARGVYKQHLLPIDENIAKLDRFGCRAIVLLRKPEETIDSYRRLGACIPDGLLEELREFHRRWKCIAIDNPERYLLLTYKNVTGQTYLAFKKIFEFYNVKRTLKTSVTLRKNRMSMERRHGIRKAGKYKNIKKYGRK